MSDGTDGPPRECCAVPVSTNTESIAEDVEVMSAIGNKTRYRALRLIDDAEDELCVCQIQPSLGVSQGAVSQALSRLHAAGLVTRRKQRQWRYYQTTPIATKLIDTLDGIRRMKNE
jgi:ArsR family transcriptional regulator